MSPRTRSLICLAGGTVLVLSTWFSTAAALPGLRTELGLSAGAAVQSTAGWSWALACLAPGPLLGAIAIDRLRRTDSRPLPIPVPALGST